MKKIYVHYGNKFLSVPCTKSEIFMSYDLELIERQKLLNFIYSVMKIKNKNNIDVNTTIDIKKDYELDNNKLYDDIANKGDEPAESFFNSHFTDKLRIITKLVLANMNPNEDSNITLNELIDRIYKYLVSLQVYDDSPFLYPIYGSSEFSQGLCRVSSIFGSIFIVNDNLNFKLHRNKEYLINPEDENNKKYIINIHDSSI